MSKRSRSDEDTVPDTEVGQLNAMDESMPGQIEAIVARDQFNACVVAAKNSVAEAEQKTEAMKEEMANWEEEKTRIANTHNFEPTVTLSVGGNIFTTTTSTLTRYPETMLGAMFSGRHALIQDKNGAYFIDRDGRHFHEILNFLRGSTASTQKLIEQRLSSGVLQELKVEVDFYGLKEFMFPFTPTDPVDIKSSAGTISTVTQGEDMLWYIQLKNKGMDAPVPVKVCSHCGRGSIPFLKNPVYARYLNFTTGRIIADAQPRSPGICSDCNSFI